MRAKLTCVAAICVALLNGCKTGPQHQFIDAKPLPSVDATKGAIIYSAGWMRYPDINDESLPKIIEEMSNYGWHVIRYNKSSQNNKTAQAYIHTPNLIEKIKELRSVGYKRVVLAGQSAGGHQTLHTAAATETETDKPLYAAVTFAPSGLDLIDYGTKVPSQTRLFMTFFDGDGVLGSGVGSYTLKALTQARNNFAIINNPPGFNGHGAAWTPEFGILYSECLAEFLDPEADVNSFVCEPDYSKISQ